MERKLKLNMTAVERTIKLKNTAMSTRFDCVTLPLGGKHGKFKDKYVVYNNIVWFQEHHTKSLVIQF